MQEHVSKHTKFKVIGGYVLLFLLTVLSTVMIYKQIMNLLVSEGEESDVNGKLFMVGHALANLYEAETLSNAFIQTGNREYFRKYTEILGTTEANIHALRSGAVRQSQAERLDSINDLLGNKLRNLQDLVYVKRTFVPEDFYDKAIAHIELNQDSVPRYYVLPRYVESWDSTYVKTERKRRRRTSRNEPDSVLNVTKSYRIVFDTVRDWQSPLMQSVDSVMSILRTTREDMQRQNEQVNRQINRREHELIRQSTEISDQLKRIIWEYEKEELADAVEKQVNRDRIARTVVRIFSVVAGLAFIFVVFFTFFILRDLSRSQRYRRELESANRYAEQLLRGREKMILTVTHDIKSPLSSVLGYIEMLTHTAVDERQRYFLKNMEGSARHILQLISNLLDLSRLENHKMQVEKVVFNPAHLFREVTDNFMPLAAAKSLTLLGRWGEGLDGDFEGDALRIRQILTNILSNAVKYTATGGVAFTATIGTDDRMLVLRVEDTGCGMTPEEQQLIFEEFTRLESHAAIEGTGLGLTITLKLIHLLGGEVKVQSAPGEGSVFTISLPVRRVAADCPAVPAVPRELPPVDGVRVLLVDDDPLQLELNAGLLGRYGIHAETTIHPREVVELLRKGHYDLLLSDIQMPEMNGFDLVKQVREQPDAFAGSLPVVALSGDVSRKEEEYFRAGFTAHLFKPFAAEQLIELIHRLCGGREAEREVPVESVEEPEGQGYTLKHIRAFADHDEEALRRILDSFVTTTREHIGRLQSSRQEGQWEEVSRLAHKMLPLFRQLEAEAVVGLLEKLEHPENHGIDREETDRLTEEVCRRAEELAEAIRWCTV